MVDQGYARGIRFSPLSSINILGDYRYSISPSSWQNSEMKRQDRDLREFAATKRQLCDLAERLDCDEGAGNIH